MMASRDTLTAFEKGKVNAYLELGFSVRGASRAVGVPYTTVCRWRSENFRLTRKKGSGRPRKTSSRTDRLIVRLVRADPTLSLTEMARVVYCSVSPSTVRRRLLESNFRSVKRPYAVELTDQHVRARLSWAMRHCHWRHQWRRVVWSDEASVRLRDCDGRLRLWIKSGARVPAHLRQLRNQGGGVLLIWAGIWTDGRTELHVQRDTMNSERYMNVLESNIPQISAQLGNTSTWLLMDDNATCHRSRAVNLFKSEAGIRTISWPARSPDLNPIENVWSLLKRNVRRSLQHHFDLNDLQSLLQREWARLDQQTINRLIDSMPARIGRVIELRGGTLTK